MRNPISHAWCLLLCMALAACGGASDTTAHSASMSATRSLTMSDATQDTISIAGYRDNFIMTVDRKAGTLTLTNKISGEKSTRPLPALVKFVDKHTYLDTAGPAARVYRLYQAAFARKPDLEGLGFWLKTHAAGRDLVSIAGDLAASEEFRQRYGEQLANRGFVQQLYQNVLRRPGEASGVDWWLAQLDAGFDRRAVLLEFADSSENKANLASDMEHGFDYVPFAPDGPLPVKRSSLEYRAAATAALGPVHLPTFANRESIGTNFAIADFFQDGSYSMVVNTADFSSASATDGYATRPGTIRFFRFANGQWVESTEAKVDDRTGCVGARKLVVADFNGDGKPDVFIACTGLDTMNSPGERPRFLMSQQNGVYANKLASFVCYCHSASAADVNNNGYADLVIADPGIALTPFYLVNNKDGSFTPDFSRMPASVAKFSYPGQSTVHAKQIYTIELVDLERRGKFDLFIGANEPNSFVTPVPADSPNYFLSSFYRNDGNERFPDAGRLAIPNLDPAFGLPLDIAVNGKHVYLLRVVSDHASPIGFYGGVAIQEVAYPGAESRTIYRHTGSYHPQQDGQNWKWFPWIGIHDGKLKSLDAAYDVQLPL